MTTSPSTGNTPATPTWKPLSPNQRRVLGVLIEKAKTTPAAYPMTVNAIVTGCNQKNNREPAMTLDDNDVVLTLNELEALGAASEAPIVSRAVKYRHHGYQWLGVDRTEMAVMTELLLRGEQTLGELRSRAARMEPIADLPALKPVIDALIQRGLMIVLTPPGRGQIVSHNLYKEPELAALTARYVGYVPRGTAFDDAEPIPQRAPQQSPAPAGHSPVSSRVPHETAAVAVTAERFAALSAEVAELQAEVARLREHIRDLQGGRP